MKSWEECKKCFDKDDIQELTKNTDGIIWLMIKSITRKELINEFISTNNINCNQKNLTPLFKETYEILIENINESYDLLTQFIQSKVSIYDKEEIEKIASELYKMRNFSWGGDYSNALDKFLVDRYIKIYRRFEDICFKLENEIPNAVNGYVMCSWYNHWSTIVIENIFKQHKKILPSIGNIKKVDFFLEGIPFDLKTTYLPVNFIEQKRKESGLKKELTTLKQIAKNYKIYYNTEAKDKDICYEIIEKIKHSENIFCKSELDEILNFRRNLALECIKNPKILIQNLYEEQGEMRFDASNRIYVILIDVDDFENSWKLKRNTQLLTKNIMQYLDSFTKEKLFDMKIKFSHKAKNGEFEAISDVIFIIKD